MDKIFNILNIQHGHHLVLLVVNTLSGILGSNVDGKWFIWLVSRIVVHFPLLESQCQLKQCVLLSLCNSQAYAIGYWEMICNIRLITKYSS